LWLTQTHRIEMDRVQQKLWRRPIALPILFSPIVSGCCSISLLAQQFCCAWARGNRFRCCAHGSLPPQGRKCFSPCSRHIPSTANSQGCSRASIFLNQKKRRCTVKNMEQTGKLLSVRFAGLLLPWRPCSQPLACSYFPCAIEATCLP